MLSRLASTQQEPQGRELPVALGCMETLEQGLQCLNQLGDKEYTLAAAPHVSSTIGEHFRHLLDLFHAIYDAHNLQGTTEQEKVIDYNFRRRGHKIEKTRAQAVSELMHFIGWLEELSAKELKAPVNILTEVSLTQQEAHIMSSTLERELTFVALHANHHFAMVKVVVSLLGLETNQDFGLAPATLSYLRGQ
ncbi:hypothetical protein OFY17_12420 [Marinomonas sp. C2222]|uniref:DinB family protein n=1 Tax=Marinomonas sargassi TaxID=2984494 RepID=A0ABT2YUW3_9GAMM|nr:DinB family protein [Marinomonas sargassi]MCV2403677.1 hypothetical protein [Marinomonas sargassi]